MRLYAFFRAEGFYPIELPDTDAIAAHAECNPGTLKVVDVVTNNVVWEKDPAP
jgi:hypothetical protein